MLYEPRMPIFEQPARASAEPRIGAAPPTQFATSPFANGMRPVVTLSPNASLAAVMMTIDRLVQVIDQETEELRKQKVADLREFNNRKSQGLLELSRAMRGLGEAARDRRLQDKLAELRAKLTRNLSVLSMHLAAAQEVSSIIARAIQDAESDGTYSVTFGVEGAPSC
jgi:hypothetical protein